MSSLATALEHLDDEEYEEAVEALTRLLSEAEGDARMQAKIFEKRAVAQLAPLSTNCPLMNLPLYSPTAPAAGLKRG